MAHQLAGDNGKILYFDTYRSKQNSPGDDKSYKELEEANYKDFCLEIDRGTEILVVDNNNLPEREYSKLVMKA
eukprot:CAMPEP_0170551726 /NCGR_PEP_ID=MMETSP0211-20121228/9729_1 /TAXON_ID=311385 /ORGANISM="Pseudokeronopsis sp., Strain OXSARD2" /LENGTH=72 /DNA_ID=CAMNT_0010859075 /DNA_START=4 /DNA_END=222 /DNA_ORIENTATION=+